MIRVHTLCALLLVFLTVSVRSIGAPASSPGNTAGPAAPPAPPTPPSPEAIPDAGTSGLIITAKSTHDDVKKRLSYYKAVGYEMTDVKEEGFSTGKIKFFHCAGKEPALLGSKTIEITMDGVRRSITATSSAVARTVNGHL